MPIRARNFQLIWEIRDYNMVHPDIGPRWTVRARVQFMFPK